MSKGDHARGRILERALRIATNVGLEGLTLGRLAEELNVSKSGLFAHFASKESLQLALIEEAIERFIALVIAPALKEPRGEPRVKALFANHLAWGRRPGGCIFISSAAEFDDRPGKVRDLIVRSQRDWLDTLARAAEIAIREKHFRAELDTEQFAFEMHSIAMGFHYMQKLLADPRATERAESAFEELVQRARRRSSSARS